MIGAWTSPPDPDTLNRMETPEQEAHRERRKKTAWLMAAGTAALLVPLAGLAAAVYLHWSRNAGAAAPSARSDVFERREGNDRKITPTQTVSMTSRSALTTPTPSGTIAGVTAQQTASSLDFVKSNEEIQALIAHSKAAAPAASTAPVAPAAAPPQAAKGRAGVKTTKKPFAMPKLQRSRGFTKMGVSDADAGAPSGNADGQNIQDLLKNLPPGAANDPRIQQYLKSREQ